MSVVTWQYAADEIRAEARCRGDLDDRTVAALAAWFEQVGRGYSETNQARQARQAREARREAERGARNPRIVRHCGCADSPCSCMSSGGSIRDGSQPADALVAEERGSQPARVETPATEEPT